MDQSHVIENSAEASTRRTSNHYVSQSAALNRFKDIVKNFGPKDIRVFFAAVDYTQMPLIYSYSVAAILPGLPVLEWEELMGFSILGAMACGSYPKVSDTPSFDEVVTEYAGTRVPAGNHKALADAVIKVIDDRDLQKHAIVVRPTYVRGNCDAQLCPPEHTRILIKKYFRAEMQH